MVYSGILFLCDAFFLPSKLETSKQTVCDHIMGWSSISFIRDKSEIFRVSSAIKNIDCVCVCVPVCGGMLQVNLSTVG